MTTNETRTIVRRTDPDTSHMAAATVAPRRQRVRDAVLSVVQDGCVVNPGLTHEDIVGMYQARVAEFGHVPPASASSIRTRVAELVDDGLVEMVPDTYGKTSMGNRARLWRAKNV